MDSARHPRRLPLTPLLDIDGNYRFDDIDQIDQSGSDTITLGALLRIDF